MLKTHKNAFLEAIQTVGLETSLFDAKEITPEKRPSRPAPSFLQSVLMFFSPELQADYYRKDEQRGDLPFFRIRLRNTHLNFTVTQGPADFNLYSYEYRIFQPGYPRRSSFDKEKALDEVLKVFKSWLEQSVRPYLNEERTPDLWLQIETYKSFVAETSGETRDASDFSDTERKDVRQSVSDFKRLLVENFKPTVEQAEFINGQLDYLTEAVDRLNRFDWRALAISVVISIAVNLSVDTEKGRLLFSLFEQAFRSTVKLLN